MRFIGDREMLGAELKRRMGDAESLTEANPGLGLAVAMAYGGRWDIAQACRSLAAERRPGRWRRRRSAKPQVAARLALGGRAGPRL